MKGLIIALVALGCVGGGYYVFDMTQRTRQAELKKAEAELRLKAKAEDAKKAQAEAKTEEAKKAQAEAEAERKTAEANTAQAKRDETKQAIELKAKETAASEAAAKQAAAEKAAAEAAAKQAVAEKAKAEAAKAASEAKAKEEELALKRAEAERKTAEAKRDETLTAAAIVKAAAEKSENERKTAEANAAAERDRKLRLYSRASLSRAEMVALQRAERLLALEESGHLARARAEVGAEGDTAAAADEDDTAATDETTTTEAPKTNAVVAVTWPPEKMPEPPDGEKVAALQKKLDDARLREHVRGARRCIAVFGERIDRAVADGRLVDAQSDRRALVSLVPDYMDVYIELIDEARKAGNETVQGKRLDELIALAPTWRRTALFVRLLTHDEAYFSRALAGRIEKNEYVRAFRKIYDVARRDKGDRDERDAKVERICRTLATYVPDFETSPEWK